MNSEKRFRIKEEDLVELVSKIAGCYATDKITVDGMPVGFMYRERPQEDWDSGWRFFSGTEEQEYVDDPNNSMIYNVNVIANYDRAIIPYLKMPIGTELERVEGTDKFRELKD